jgi:lysophosphatidylcholine acyltransferase/lyso-PAF acetyltransferase
MALFGTGFVAKIGASKVPIIGPLIKSMQSIFVDRSSDKAKENILDILEKREREYYEGKPVMPFMIFPEGTTSSGRHILPFKKGAFGSLLPVKATFIHPNLYENYHIGVGSSDVACNYLRSLANLYNKVEYVELPVLTPNDYMYENFEHFGKEKWEIFAEVTREIMVELGGFKKSNRGIKDNFRYCSYVEKKTLLDSKTYKIE